MPKLRFLPILSLSVALTLLTALVEAQPPEGGGRRGGGGRGGFRGRQASLFPLLQNDAVLAALKVPDDQTGKIAEFAETTQAELGEQLQEVFASFRDMSPEERQEAQAEIAKLNQDAEAKLADLLNEEQMTRLRQIALQVAFRQSGGAAALRDPSIADKLELTPDQRDELQEIAQENRRGRDEDAPTLAEARDQVTEVLDDAQMAKLAEMLGDEFDAPEELLVRRGGRGGGFGGGGRRGGEGQ